MLKKVNLNDLSPDSRACFDAGMALVEEANEMLSQYASEVMTPEEEDLPQDAVEPDSQAPPETEEPPEEEATAPATVDEAMEEKLEEATEEALK